MGSSEMPVVLSFKKGTVTIIFDHQYLPPEESKVTQAKSIMHIKVGEELPIFFTVFQARNPGEVKRLVSALKVKLENESFEGWQESLLKYAVKALSDLAGTPTFWIEGKEDA